MLKPRTKQLRFAGNLLPLMVGVSERPCLVHLGGKSAKMNQVFGNALGHVPLVGGSAGTSAMTSEPNMFLGDRVLTNAAVLMLCSYVSKRSYMR